MPDTIATKDISEFIRLKKLRAEFLFKEEFLSNAGTSNSLISGGVSELNSIDAQLSRIESKMLKANFTIVLPNETKINELSTRINSSSNSDIISALRSKDGELYNLLVERGRLIKRNFELRNEIGKINILIHTVEPQLKSTFQTALRDMAFEGLNSFTVGEELRVKIGRILSRLGISFSNCPTYEETEVTLDNQKIWIQKDLVEDLKKNLETTNKLLTKIQLKNAERQIRSFNDDEEKDFANIQHEYLALLKRKDELLKQHYDECNEYITVG